MYVIIEIMMIHTLKSAVKMNILIAFGKYTGFLSNFFAVIGTTF